MFKFAYAALALLVLFVAGAVLSLVFRLDWNIINAILHDREILFALKLSISTSFLSLMLASVIGIPAAWLMSHKNFPGKRLLDIMLDIPMVTPPLVVGIGLLMLLGQSGIVGKTIPFISDHLFSPLGVVIAQTYVASSILVRSAMSAFISIDREYVHTAYNLGLTPSKAFFLVEIPLVWRALAGGCILAFARCLGEFGGTLMLAGAIRLKTETLPMAIYLNIASGDFQKAIACAVLLIVIACLLLLLLHFFQKPGGKYADN